MFDINTKAIIIDNGSHMIKAGIADDESPSFTIRSIIPTPKYHDLMPEMYKEVMINENETYKWAFNYKYPFTNGYIADWDDMKNLWSQIFYNQLQVPIGKHPVLITEPPFNSKSFREKMAEIMFETFNVPALYVTVPAVLSLASLGKCSGMVVDLGHDWCYSIPVYESYSLRGSTLRIDQGGSSISRHLENLMLEKGLAINRGFTEYIKENLCYVTLDFEEEMARSNHAEYEKDYRMPDGSSIMLGKERFIVAESLFSPRDWFDPLSIVDMACKSIEKSDRDLRKTIYGNILMSGGSSMFPGLVERFHKEISALAPPSMNIHILAPPERKNSAWLGGSILSSLSSFQQLWIKKDEYDEWGCAIVHHKCF